MHYNGVAWVDKPNVPNGLWICWVHNPTYPRALAFTGATDIRFAKVTGRLNVFFQTAYLIDFYQHTPQNHLAALTYSEMQETKLHFATA